MGRTAQGVGGIKLLPNDEVAGAIETNENGVALLISDNGYGKRLRMSDISPHGRNTQGRYVYDVTEKTGELVGVLSVEEDDAFMAITSQGNSISVEVNTVPIYKPDTQGVRIVNIQKPDYVVGIDRPASDVDRKDDEVGAQAPGEENNPEEGSEPKPETDPI